MDIIQFNGEPIWALRDRISYLKHDYESNVILQMPDGQLSSPIPAALFVKVADILELFSEDIRKHLAGFEATIMEQRQFPAIPAQSDAPPLG